MILIEFGRNQNQENNKIIVKKKLGFNLFFNKTLPEKISQILQTCLFSRLFLALCLVKPLQQGHLEKNSAK